MSGADYVLRLQPNEEYSERCGEVFLTNIGYLVFHCTLCDMKFKGFQKFADHIREEHLLPSNYSDSFLGSELAKFNYTCDYDYDIDDVEDKKQDVEYGDMVEEHLEFDESDENVTSTPKANIFQSMENLESTVETDNTTKLGANCPVEQESTSNSTFRPIRTVPRFSTSAGERKFKCPLCGATFKEKHNLNHHVIRHDEDEKKFPCTQCERKFYSAAERRVHLRIHTQERPFLCSECGLSFITNILLVKHIKRHRNQRDHHCPHCEKSFYERSSLTAHLQTHSTNRSPYVCEICNTRFMHSRSLKHHLTMHNNS